MRFGDVIECTLPAGEVPWWNAERWDGQFIIEDVTRWGRFTRYYMRWRCRE